MKNKKKLFVIYFSLFFSSFIFADYNNLKEAINDTTSIKEYCLTNNEMVTEDLGKLRGTQLTIFGNSYEIDGNSKAGITVSDGQILNIEKGIGENFVWKNFKIFNEDKSGSGTRSDAYGGVIYNSSGTINIDLTKFESNSISAVVFNSDSESCSLGFGGVIYNSSGTINIDLTTFESNSTSGYFGYGFGGAIYNEVGTINIDSTKFELNSASGYSSSYSGNGYGGAIYNGGAGLITISSSSFISNEATGSFGSGRGGAIYNHKGGIIISSTTFDSNKAFFLDGNKAYGEGGAIYNAYEEILFKDGVKFINNEAQTQGGAIYNYIGSITLIANTEDIVFSGNKANGISNAIHNFGGTINMSASKNASIIFNDRITDQQGYLYINGSLSIDAVGKIILNEDMSGHKGKMYLYGGEIELQAKTEEGSNINTNKFFGGDINLRKGTLNVLNNSIDNITINSLNRLIKNPMTTTSANLKIDVDLSNNTSDNFTVRLTATGILNLTAINILGVNETSGQITLFNNEISPRLYIGTTAGYGGYEYIFTNSDVAGVLNYKKDEEINLKKAINRTIPSILSYSLAENEKVTEDLGLLGRTELTIFGNGYKIDGNSKAGITVSDGQILNIEKGIGENFVWKNFKRFIENESNVKGGVIYNDNGAITIDSTKFESNNASGSCSNSDVGRGYGGAIYNKGTIDINSSMFNSNEVTYLGDDIYGYGGAVYNDNGTINIDSTKFESNNANVSGSNKGYGYGGAIYNNNGTITINSTKFKANAARGSGYVSNSNAVNDVNDYSGNGSGVGGAIYNDKGTINISSTTFDSNIAEGYDSNIGYGKGGAIYNYSGLITISSSIFRLNESITPNGSVYHYDSRQSYGGAIYNGSGGKAIINSTTFDSNKATSRGVSNTYGGAIYNNYGDITFKDGVKFINNEAQTQGGAIYNNGKGTIIISSTTFNSNKAVWLNGNHASGYGGAIYNDIGTIMISSTSFSSNEAIGFVTSSHTEFRDYGYGGAIYNQSGKITISSTKFESNKATIADSGNSGYGGAIYNQSGEIIISSTTFKSNSAKGFSGSGGASGGAIYNDKGKIIISSTTFESNRAEAFGGAIYNNFKAIMTFTDGVKFINNKASKGGAIYNNTGTINLMAKTSNIEFTGNTAGKSNAIYDSGGTINLWASNNASIIFNDRIISQSNNSTLNINSSTTTLIANGKIILNEDMSGYTGHVFLYGGEIELQAKMEEGSNINTNKFFGSVEINLSSGTLNILNSAIDNITVRHLTTTSNTNLKFDADLSNNTSDNFTVTNTVSGELNLTAINILGVNETSGQIKLFNNSKSPILNILTTANYGGYEYTFTNSTIAGILNYKKTGTTKTFKEIVNDTEPTIRSYSLAENETVTENLGQLGGTELIIFGNNKNIEGDNVTGIFVAKDKTLNIENVNNWNGFNNTYGAIKNEGTLNISGTNFSNNVGQDIINNGNLTLAGSASSFEKGIVGIGTTTINGVNINLANAIIEQNKIEINNNGSLITKAKNIVGNIENNSNLIFSEGTNENYIYGTGITTINGSVINSSTIVNNITINENKQLTTNANNITGKINNLGSYVLTGGENKNWVYGIGTTIVDGEVINSSTIVNAVTINENKQLTTLATNITGNIKNKGSLIFNGGTNNNLIIGTGLTQISNDVINQANITQNNLEILANKQLTNSTATITVNELLTINNNAKIINDGKLVINSGTNNGIIEQTIKTSTTIINGNFVNNGTIEQTIFNVEENGKIQNNNIITATTIINNGSIETNATNISGNIENNGTLLFNAGVTNNNKITGIGTLNITVNNLINNNSIEQMTITISKEENNVNTLSSSNSQQELNTFINNSSISTENLNLKSINFKLTENGNLFAKNLYTQNSEIDLANSILQKHNFKTITLTDNLNLYVDADLENKNMDTISAENFEGSGKINIKAINILSDAKENKTEILFTTSTILKEKITSTTTASSKLYKYDVIYNDGYFYFTNDNMPKINPIIAESAIASSVGGFATQANVLGLAFTSIDTQISSRKQAKKKSILYAYASSSIFDMENKIENGLWIRPYTVQETVKFSEIDVDNTAVGTLAGLDLATGENSLISFYLGYAGSNQKYEDIKISQTGYIVGATGMIIKEKWYAGLTANINFNKAESQSDYGTDEFDMNMYSVGAKAGYNFDLSDKWTLEPNLMLMYGTVSNQEYETTQGAKIDSQSNSNIIVEPQVKAKVDLTNGWQPYGLLGYVANISDKAKVVVDEAEFETDKINGYVEYGAGVNKDFINTPWSCYLEATGRSGGRNGFSGNLGIKYRF